MLVPTLATNEVFVPTCSEPREPDISPMRGCETTRTVPCERRKLSRICALKLGPESTAPMPKSPSRISVAARLAAPKGENTSPVGGACWPAVLPPLPPPELPPPVASRMTESSVQPKRFQLMPLFEPSVRSTW